MHLSTFIECVEALIRERGDLELELFRFEFSRVSRVDGSLPGLDSFSPHFEASRLAARGEAASSGETSRNVRLSTLVNTARAALALHGDPDLGRVVLKGEALDQGGKWFWVHFDSVADGARETSFKMLP